MSEPIGGLAGVWRKLASEKWDTADGYAYLPYNKCADELDASLAALREKVKALLNESQSDALEAEEKRIPDVHMFCRGEMKAYNAVLKELRG